MGNWKRRKNSPFSAYRETGGMQKIVRDPFSWPCPGLALHLRQKQKLSLCCQASASLSSLMIHSLLDSFPGASPYAEREEVAGGAGPVAVELGRRKDAVGGGVTSQGTSCSWKKCLPVNHFHLGYPSSSCLPRVGNPRGDHVLI